MKIFDLCYLEDVSEARSIVGGSSLEVSIIDGEAQIRSSGFKVVQKKEGNAISIKATSSGSSATNVSITTSFLDTELDDELED